MFPILCVLAALSIAGALQAQPAGRVLGTLAVHAGAVDRIDTPVRFACRPTEIFGDPAPARRPGFHSYIGNTADLAILRDNHLALVETGSGQHLPVQWAIDTDFGWEAIADKGALLFILPGRTPAGSVRSFQLVLESGAETTGPFSVDNVNNTWLQVQRNGKPVLRYNYDIIREKPGQTSVQDRSSYLHPVWAPNGQVVTGDFSPEHAHQRGIFFAWTRARFGEVEADFWNLAKNLGRVLPDMYGPSVQNGPVFTELDMYNKGVVNGKTYFKEVNAVRVYAIPGENYRLFDIYVRQVPVNPETPDIMPEEILITGATPSALKDKQVPTSAAFTMTIDKFHYGGMAFRGMSDWLKGGLDILTSEGLNRDNGDAQPARWIDYTGPLGSDWGGVAMFDNPLNQRYPTPVRIHPQLPYCCFAWPQVGEYAVKGNQSLDLVYRFLVHNGKPDKILNERIARDFIDAPEVKWTPAIQ